MRAGLGLIGFDGNGRPLHNLDGGSVLIRCHTSFLNPAQNAAIGGITRVAGTFKSREVGSSFHNLEFKVGGESGLVGFLLTKTLGLLPEQFEV